MREFVRVREKQLSINVVNGTVESIRKKDIKRVGCRIYQEGYIGVAGGIGDVNEEELVQQATINLSLKIPYERQESEKVVQKEDRREAFDEQTFIQQVEQFLEIINNKYPDFIFSNKINVDEVDTTLENDRGTHLNFKDRTITLMLAVREKTSVNIFDTMVSYETRVWKTEEMLTEVEKVLGTYHIVVQLPDKEKMPVVLYHRMLTYKLEQELEGEAIGEGSSLFKDVLGKEVFHAEFTYGQKRTNEKFNTPFFDAEGVVNPELMSNYIENGKIVTPYTDYPTAKKYGFTHTGNSVASYDSVPRNGLAYSYVKSSGKSLKELLNGELGILVIIASGGDYTGDGDYATPVQCAMLIDGEKILGRLPLINIAGNLYNLFGKDYRGMTEEAVLNGAPALVVDMQVNLG